MSFSLYIGSEPPYKADTGAWDHDLSGYTVQERLHEVTHQAIPSLANEELFIVVGKHGDAEDIDRGDAFARLDRAFNLDEQKVIKFALRLTGALQAHVDEGMSDGAADLYRSFWGEDYGDQTFAPGMFLDPVQFQRATRDTNVMAMNLDPQTRIMHAIVAVVEDIVERELDDLRADLTGAREDLERDINNLDTKVDEVDSRVTDLESPT